MILGYEQPVDIPVMSMYDKDMMKMYLGALREDYQQGVKDQEEFNKMASEFYSPISKDNERWYNITTKPILDFLNQNPDAIRTVEGRSKIRQFINSRPYGDMANLRQSAANAKLFDAARQKMMQDGTYSDDMAKFFNEDFANWDTLENGVWGKVAPTKYAGMEEALLPTVQMLQKSMRVDPEASKNHPGWIISNVSKKQVDDAINKAYGDLMKIPYMQYHLHKSGLDENGFKELLSKQAHSQTGEKWEQDPIYMLRMKLAAEAAENKKDRALKRELAKPPKEENPMLSKKIEQRTFEKMGQVHAPIFEKYMRTMAKNAKNDKDRKMWEGYAKEWHNYPKLSVEDQAAFLQKYGYLDQYGLTDKYFDWFGKANGVFRGNTVQSRQTSRKNAWEYYNNHLVEVQGAEEAETLVSALAGSVNKQKNGYYGVSFGGKVSFSPVRAMMFGGHNTLVKNKGAHSISNSLEYQFDSFLKKNKIHGNVYDTSALKTGSLPGRVLEVSGMRVSVPYSEIKSFISVARKNRAMLTSGIRADRATDAQILKDLGISIVTPEGHPVSITTVTKKDESGNSSTERETVSRKESPVYYALIDASGTLNADGTSLSALNDSYNKRLMGGTPSERNLGAAYEQAESFRNSLLFDGD